MISSFWIVMLCAFGEVLLVPFKIEEPVEKLITYITAEFSERLIDVCCPTDMFPISQQRSCPFAFHRGAASNFSKNFRLIVKENSVKLNVSASQLFE